MKMFRSASFSKIAGFLVVAGLCQSAHAGSILVSNAGVEVYKSWVVLTQGYSSGEQVGGSRITREGETASIAYGLTGNLLIGMDAVVTRMIGTSTSPSIEPDLRVKWNFWSKLSPGHYHRLALQASVAVPMGGPTNYFLDQGYTGPGGSHLRFAKPTVVPTVDLIYSRATYRWVYGASAGYSDPTADRNGLRLGDVKKASVDVEYAFWRGERSEVSFVLGSMVRQFGRAQLNGASFGNTGGSDAVVSCGIQYAPMPTVTFEASYSSDVWSAMRPGQPRMGNEILFGMRILR
jgi:hypothetical protein